MRKINKNLLFVTLSILLMFQSCKKSKPTEPSFKFEKQEILASDTDPNIDMLPSKKHLVWYPEHKNPLPELFIFLPGTGSSPSGYKWIQRYGVYVGYRTIGLAYVNDESVVDRCIGQDSSCTYWVRYENATGDDVSDNINVNHANSIQNRIIKLLEYLHLHNPTQGWNMYINNGELVWNKIIFGGHSQGSGQAGFFSKEHDIAKGLFFSSPGDTHPISQTELPPAPWSLEPRLTDASKLYCFYHTNERTAQRNEEIFAAIGMDRFGGLVNEAQISTPFNGSHTIVTSYPYDNSNSIAHNLPINDPFIPLDDNGHPIFEDVYLYFLTHVE